MLGPYFLRSSRLLHSSARSCVNYVGPFDPVSNLRPVIYDDLPPSPQLGHPYSLKEFAEDTQDHNLYWRLHRQQLDAFNHEFWTDNNTRFEAAKQIVLSRVPESSSPLVRERALSQFYREWLLQEARRQEVYTSEWRKRNSEAIVLAARAAWRNFQGSIKSYLTYR
jgi:hypothetical protein